MSASMTGEMIGNVRLDKLLGESTIGVAYRGHHTTLGIGVVVKMLKSERHQAQASYYYEYFLREAQIAARLDGHPNIVRVLDFGQHNKLPYIVMDWVDGFSLQAYLANRKTPLDEQTILKVLLSAAGALDGLHGVGVVHHDIKPSNLFISRRGQMKIASFGLASLEEGTSSASSPSGSLSPQTKVILLTDAQDAVDTPEKVSLTEVLVIGGAPAYMAPEIFVPDGTANAQSDIYALGIIGYQMLFGTLPYQGDVVQIINGHLQGNASFELPTSCSPEVINIVKHMMHHDPARRPKCARDILRVIRPLLQTAPTRTSEVALGSGLDTMSTGIKHSMLSDVAQSMERRLNDPEASEEGTKSSIFYRTRQMMGRLLDPTAARTEKKPDRS